MSAAAAGVSAGPAGPAWTTADDIRAKVRRRWEDGTILTAYVLGEPCPVVEVPIRGPAPGELGGRLGEVREWKAALERAAAGGLAFELETKTIGGRAVGRNEVPARARVSDFEQVGRLLGVRAELVALDSMARVTRHLEPVLVPWLATRARHVHHYAGEWERVLAAARWLADRGGQGLYVRQIDIGGIDTKFVEARKGVLAELLDMLVPPDRVDPHHSRSKDFAPRYGFAEPEPLIQIRCQPGFAGLPEGVSEIGWRSSELARLSLTVDHVVIVENLVTYLSTPIPPDGVVIWGSGYAVSRVGRYPWLRASRRITYAGDIDTHGFAILSMLRGQLAHVESLLMDRATLLAHRDRWGRESKPTRAALSGLTDAERAIYADLVEDVYAPALRLEQERLDWSWVRDATDWL